MGKSGAVEQPVQSARLYHIFPPSYSGLLFFLLYVGPHIANERILDGRDCG